MIVLLVAEATALPAPVPAEDVHPSGRAAPVLDPSGRAPPVLELVAPISEIDHPSYADGAGTPVDWREVRSLASNTDALRRVRQRRLGRTVLRFTFAAATAVEAWGTYELVRRDNDVLAGVLGAQAAFTGLSEVLMFTGIPSWRTEDRAILLSGANGWVRTSSP